MKNITLLFILALITNFVTAQGVYTIKADSVKLTGCDSSELIIENHTQNVPGFLFNTGKGRTIFKKGLLKINDSLYLIGPDTLKVQPYPWVQGGNAFGNTGVLGTSDDHPLDLYTTDSPRVRIFSPGGNVGIGTGTTDRGFKLDVNGKVMLENTDGPQLHFDTRFGGSSPLTMGYESNYNFYTRTNNGGQGSINMDFSGMNGYSYIVDAARGNTLVQQFTGDFILAPALNKTINFGDINGSNTEVFGSNSTVRFYRCMDGSYHNYTTDPVISIRNGHPSETNGNVYGEKAYWYRNGYIGIGTNNGNGVNPAAPRAAITINQGTLTGYNNLSQSTNSTVNTTGSSTTVTFLPDNGNAIPSYGIIPGTVITANGETRTVAVVNYSDITLDSAVDWSAGYSYTYRNPYVDVSDGSTPVFKIAADKKIGIGANDPLSSLDIAGSNGYSQLRIRTHYTPSSSADANGNAGDIAVDDDYFYYKTSTGWKRMPLSNF